LGAGETAIGNPDFDRTYRIETDNPAALRQWFTPALVAAHSAGHIPPAWSVQGTELLCHRPGRLTTQAVPSHATIVLRLADLIDMPYSPISRS
jgi:hypothetical protein